MAPAIEIYFTVTVPGFGAVAFCFWSNPGKVPAALSAGSNSSEIVHFSQHYGY